MNKRLLLPSALLLLFSAALLSCGKKTLTEGRIVHCDRCGKECTVSADSNMTDEWFLYCSECEEELGLHTLISLEE